jgi:hypothetical protein
MCAVVADEQGQQVERADRTGAAADAEQLGRAVARDLESSMKRFAHWESARP